MTEAGAASSAETALDPRLNAVRPDLADVRLQGKVEAARFVAGQPAWVIAGRTAARADRTPQAETISYFHYGEELRVFETAEHIAWCQALFDGYVGYVDTFDIEFGPAPVPTHYVATMGAYAYAEPDLRSMMAGCLPRHSAVAVARRGLVTRGAEYAWIDIAGYVPLNCLSEQPPRSASLAAAASLYIGAPYLWGGRSFFGIDCSGLVQNAFRDLGLIVPRDTDLQQQAIGESVTVGHIAELQPDDLLFLPGHVLIHEGQGGVIHADGASMMVRRDRLDRLMAARGLDLSGFVVRRRRDAAA